MLYEINDQQKELIQVALDAYANSDGPRHFQTDIDVARAALDKSWTPIRPTPKHPLSDEDAITLIRRIEQSLENWVAAVESTILAGESVVDDLREHIDYEEEYSELLNELLDIRHFNTFLNGRLEAIVKNHSKVADWKRDVAHDVTLDGYEEWKRDLVDTIMGAL